VAAVMVAAVAAATVVAAAATVAAMVAAVAAAVRARIRLNCWTLPSAVGLTSLLSVPAGSSGLIGHELARSYHRDRRFCWQFSG
jgi:hypothetical protein